MDYVYPMGIYTFIKDALSESEIFEFIDAVKKTKNELIIKKIQEYRDWVGVMYYLSVCEVTGTPVGDDLVITWYDDW